MAPKRVQRSRSVSPNPTPRVDPEEAKKKGKKKDKNERKTSDELRRTKSTGALPKTWTTPVQRISKSTDTSPGNPQAKSTDTSPGNPQAKSTDTSPGNPYINNERSTNLRTGISQRLRPSPPQRYPTPEPGMWAAIVQHRPSTPYVRRSEPVYIEELDGSSPSAQSSSTNVRPDIVIHSEADVEDREVEAGPGPSNVSVPVSSPTRELPPLRIEQEDENVAGPSSIPIHVLPITSHTVVQPTPTSRPVRRNRSMPRDVPPGAVPSPDLPSLTPPLSPSRTLPEPVEIPIPIIAPPQSQPPAQPRGFLRRFFNVIHAGFEAFRQWIFG